jgi:hypothetical protein
VLDIFDELRDDFTVSHDETRMLMLKIIEQAIRDYVNLRKSTVPIEVQYWESARDFLFDPEYRIDWGEFELDIEDILDYLSLDYDWFKRKLIELTSN